MGSGARFRVGIALSAIGEGLREAARDFGGASLRCVCLPLSPAGSGHPPHRFITPSKREVLWKASRSVSERMTRRLDPQPGDTVLELAAGLADTGLMAARLVGESGRVIATDFTPEMVSGARRRAEEL